MVSPAVGAALINVGGSLLGGLFGNRKQKTTTSVNYLKMRKNALAAGFNPLTALRNGGSANATTTQTPALSSGQFIAEAVSSGLNTIFNEPQRVADQEQEQLQTQLMREELRQLQAGTAVVRDRDFGYSIPQVNTSSGNDLGPMVQTEIPPMMVPVQAPDGSTVMVGNQGAGLENSEGIAMVEFLRQNPEYVQGVAADAAPWVAGAYAGYRGIRYGFNSLENRLGRTGGGSPRVVRHTNLPALRPSGPLGTRGSGGGLAPLSVRQHPMLFM